MHSLKLSVEEIGHITRAVEWEQRRLRERPRKLDSNPHLLEDALAAGFLQAQSIQCVNAREAIGDKLPAETTIVARDPLVALLNFYAEAAIDSHPDYPTEDQDTIRAIAILARRISDLPY